MAIRRQRTTRHRRGGVWCGGAAGPRADACAQRRRARPAGAPRSRPFPCRWTRRQGSRHRRGCVTLPLPPPSPSPDRYGPGSRIVLLVLVAPIGRVRVTPHEDAATAGLRTYPLPGGGAPGRAVHPCRIPEGVWGRPPHHVVVDCWLAIQQRSAGAVVEVHAGHQSARSYEQRFFHGTPALVFFFFFFFAALTSSATVLWDGGAEGDV